MHKTQTGRLREAALAFSDGHGEDISKSVETNAGLLVHWIHYLAGYHVTGIADSLLVAVGSSIRETAGALSLGLLRPSLFSLRCQIDLVLAWLYFKDHKVEWNHVNQTADGFKLKKELFQYLENHNKGFALRFGILKDIATRQEKDPYRLLSAHIHGQSDPVLPAIANLDDMVRPILHCQECTRLVLDVSEFLSDVLLSVYVANWHALPIQVQQQVSARFVSNQQRAAFFS